MTAPSQPNEPRPEVRAAWADAWREGFLTPAQVSQLVDTLHAAHYNVIIAQVRKCGDAYYNSAYEPRANNIGGPPGFDPLADLIAKAHAAGMQVHAWLTTYRIWNSAWPAPPSGHIWHDHPEWAMLDRDKKPVENGFYNLDPGIPAVQDYIWRVAADIVEKYDVDGINWDYVRYPAASWGYNEITQTRFFDEYGYYPPLDRAGAGWEAWAQYRRQQVTDLVRKCYLEIAARKPRVVMSADTVAWLGPDPNHGYTVCQQYAEALQDSRGWLNDHLLDMVFQMNYKREDAAPAGAQAADYRRWSEFVAHTAASAGRIGVDGQAAYLNSVPGTVAQMLYARSAGCGGMATYSYGSTNRDNLAAARLWEAVNTQVYPTPAAIPTLPWKSAGNRGILFGTVTNTGPAHPIYAGWAYGGTVSVEGPVKASARTDATGTYGFLDLPPGAYRLSASAPGWAAQTCDVTVAGGGSVVRQDVALNKPLF